jgi:broad specificity phosphatase PhoE
MEFNLGTLQGLLHTQLRRQHPEFFDSPLGESADYARWGGESHQEQQERVVRVSQKLQAAHRPDRERVLVVGHGGFGTQLVKYLVCASVPQVCKVKFGNCTAMLVRMSEDQSARFGQLLWQVPVESMQR